jgi:hypothetical protein
MSMVDIVNSIQDAIETVPGVRAYTDPGADIDPPGVVIGLPTIEFETYGGIKSPGPTEATLTLYLVVRADDRATSNLSGLIDQVANAIWSVADYSVMRSQPGIWVTSNNQLPCYVLDVVGPAN